MISVIIPIKNAEKTIKKSIDSVLNQDVQNIEVICVVNSTSDNTVAEIESIDDDRIKILYSRPGIVAALNEGLRASKGDFIARQDADDVWLAGKLKKQLDFLDKNPDVDILGTQLNVVDANGKFIRKTSYPTTHEQIVSHLFIGNNPIGHPSVIFRRIVLDKCSGYWDLFPLAEDLDLWLRCVPWFKMSNLEDHLVQYQHVPNSSYNPNVPRTVSAWYRMIYGVQQ